MKSSIFSYNILDYTLTEIMRYKGKIVFLCNDIRKLIFDKSFKIIITGGFSKLFKNSIKTKVKQDFDITINGLIKASKLIK